LVRDWAPLECSIILDGGIDRPAMEASSSERLFELAGDCAGEVGLPPLAQASVGGASDGNLTAAAGVATLDGLGAVGDGAHADHEWASVADLAPRTALAAALIRRILDEKPGEQLDNK
jgi:glutamate carboxypeptidase